MKNTMIVGLLLSFTIQLSYAYENQDLKTSMETSNTLSTNMQSATIGSGQNNSTIVLAQTIVKIPEQQAQVGNVSDIMVEGEIRKVDKDNKKLTIKHGEIKNLEMPGMTMVFQVKDTAMLDKIKAGDKIKFSAEKLGGAIVVTDIQMNK